MKLRYPNFIVFALVLAIISGCNAFAENELDIDMEIQQKLSRNIAYEEQYDGQLIEELSRSIEVLSEVEDVRILISGPTIIVGVLSYEENMQAVEQKVRQKTARHVGAEDIRVIFDDEKFHRTKQVKDSLEEIISPNPVGGDRTNYLER